MACNLPDKLSDFNQLTRRRSGELHAACPESGTNGDRLIITKARIPNRLWVYCRQCRLTKMIYEDDAIASPSKVYTPYKVREPKEIPISVAINLHRALGPHKEYFLARGITQDIIDDHYLGWSESMERYSIPLIEDNKVHAIQLRRSHEEQGPKYIQYKGGSPKRLFNTHSIKGSVLFITEGPLDALALESMGVPCIAQFDGNSEGGWDESWTQSIASIATKVIIADNDDEGTKIAMYKHQMIPDSTVITPPAPYKDAGEMIKAGCIQTFEALMPFLAAAKASIALGGDYESY